MIYKMYKCNSFNVHTLKTNKFKTSHIEIIFRKQIIKEELGSYALLIDVLSENSKAYPTRKDLIIKFEELYKMSIYGTTSKTGNVLNSSFIVDFINPEYIDDKNYLEEVIKLPFELLQNPNATNEEFDLKTFNIVKERIKREIKSINDNSFKVCVKKAFEAMDKNSPTAYSLFGTIEEIDKITPDSLYKLYKKFFKENVCDIFVIGNLDMDEVVSLIKKNFKHRYINNSNLVLKVDNKVKKKETIKSDISDNIQANMVMIYNIKDLNPIEKNITFSVFNYIFGNGGLTCKLYQRIREENSLCYSINSMYLKYDELLLVHVSLENSNVKKAITLINKCLKEMVSGNFTEEEVKDAVANLCISLDLAYDNNVSLLNNYVFNYFDNMPLIDERKDMLNKTTREDVINLAKKIKLNTVFTLKGKEEE